MGRAAQGGVSVDFPAALRDAKVILGRLTPGLPLRCASGSPWANFRSSLRDAFGAPAVRRAVLGYKVGFVDPGSEGPGLGLSAAHTFTALWLLLVPELP
jgi:hypothetical protein